MVARWFDGVSWKISDLTVAGWQKLVAGRTRVVEEPLWTGVQHSSHNHMHISQRLDHSLLMSIFEQSRQIMQVRVDIFGPLPSPQPAVVPRLDDTLQKCLKFMTDGDISVQQLKEFRDNTLRAEGWIKHKQMKRPAAAARDDQEGPPATDAARNDLEELDVEEAPKQTNSCVYSPILHFVDNDTRFIYIGELNGTRFSLCELVASPMEVFGVADAALIG